MRREVRRQKAQVGRQKLEGEVRRQELGVQRLEVSCEIEAVRASRGIWLSRLSADFVAGRSTCNLIFVADVNSSIRSLFIEGPAGRLEGLLNSGAGSATHAAVVCHPHPLFGGTMHNKVVFHTMKALNGFGFPVLRFNFRGTGLSEGEHNHGVGEVEDVQAALNWLDSEFHLPLIFAGFSFGAAVGLRAACGDARVRAAIGVGTPVAPVAAETEQPREYSFDFLQGCMKPKLLVSGARDQFGPRAKLETLIASMPEPKKLVVIEGADHFFEGRLRELREAIESWVKEAIGSQRTAFSRV